MYRPWAAYDKNIAVAASTNADVRASYSDYGTGITVCAPSSTFAVRTSPGIGITTSSLPLGGDLPGHTGGGNDYTNTFGGTSSAAPLVAGLAALILSANRQLSWNEVKKVLTDTAAKIDANNINSVGRWIDINGKVSTDPGYLGPNYSQWYGYGRIDAHSAIQQVAGTQQISVNTAVAGTQQIRVDVTGVNFTPNQNIQIFSHPSTIFPSTPQPVTTATPVVTDSGGTFNASFIAVDAGPNSFTYLAARDTSGKVAWSMYGSLIPA